MKIKMIIKMKDFIGNILLTFGMIIFAIALVVNHSILKGLFGFVLIVLGIVLISITISKDENKN